ncbi:metal ABC transporter ATP-binding protein [Niallia sp. XMNu-256]|uniref:metal ABC transporter ATP-binding protein n=1 Tax=Niallia sp. XMNu-256 TaxID=3082444 RepID=UPI0030D0CAB6
MNKMGSIIQIKELTYRYEKEAVLENIHFSIEEGAFLGIVGPNGSGKSTLLKLILGLLKTQQGEIILFGEEQSRFKDWQKVGFVSQKANSFNTGFPATVFEVVQSGLTKRIGLFRRMTKDQHKKVAEAIESVGLAPFSKRNIGELSGGQQQRAFIARALVSDPKLLILDEPTVGVDAVNVEAFYHILEHLNKDLGITLVLVTHDIGTMADKVTEIVYLNKKIWFRGNAKEFAELSSGGMPSFYNLEPAIFSHEQSLHHHGGHQS